MPRRPANDSVTVEAVHAINQRIFETSLDLILVTDRKGTFVRVSPSSMAILGGDPAEMVGHSAAECLHGEDLENTRNEMRLTRRNLTMRNFDCRYAHKEGRIVTLWWSGVWSATEQQYFFIGRDVTERKAAERRLRESARLLEAAMDVAQLGSWVSEVTPGDATGGRLEWSRRSHLIRIPVAARSFA